MTSRPDGVRALPAKVAEGLTRDLRGPVTDRVHAQLVPVDQVATLVAAYDRT